jgi:hypothetical protein
MGSAYRVHGHIVEINIVDEVSNTGNGVGNDQSIG